MSAIEEFSATGFIVLRSAFSAAEAAHFREQIVRLSREEDPAGDDSRRFNRWEGVTRHREFWPVIDHPPLLRAARAVGSDDIRYAHNSEVHAHNAGYLWHRDCLDQIAGAGPDWDETLAPYRLLRAAIFLQSHAESGFEFGVVPGSHRRSARTLVGLAADLQQRVRGRLRLRPPRRDPRCRREPLITVDRDWLARLRPATPTWIHVDAGDCVLMDQRLAHSASEIRGPQYAIYFAYGPDDVHSHRQWHHYRFERPDRPLARLTADLASRLDAAGLLSEYDRADVVGPRMVGSQVGSQ